MSTFYAEVNGTQYKRETNTFFGCEVHSYYILRKVKTPGQTGANSLEFCRVPEHWKKVIAEVDRQAEEAA